MTPTDSFIPFSALPLHDAVLTGLRLDWKQRTCVAEVNGFDPQQPAVPRLILWSGVRETRVPHHEPWGPSCFINAVYFEAPDLYVVEMQSGDQIAVTADSFRFVTPPA